MPSWPTIDFFPPDQPILSTPHPRRDRGLQTLIPSISIYEAKKPWVKEHQGILLACNATISDLL
jgi:hypothetical protein